MDIHHGRPRGNNCTFATNMSKNIHLSLNFFWLPEYIYNLQQNLSALAFLYIVFHAVTIHLVSSQHTSQSFKENKERTARDSLSMTNRTCHSKCMANLK